MNRCCQLYFVALLLCWGGCLLALPGRGAVVPRDEPKSPADVRLGAETVAILQGATRVETFRIGNPSVSCSFLPARMDGHWLNSKGPTKDKAFAAQVTKILLDPQLYADTRDRCLFSPGVIFRFWKGSQRVDCLMCFHCDDILILAQDPQGHTTHTAFTNFGARQPALLALVKRAFPADKEIQALPAK